MKCRTTENCAFFNVNVGNAGHCFLLGIGAYLEAGGPQPSAGWVGGSIVTLSKPTEAPTLAPTTQGPTLSPTAEPSPPPNVPTEKPTTAAPTASPTLAPILELPPPLPPLPPEKYCGPCTDGCWKMYATTRSTHHAAVDRSLCLALRCLRAAAA